VISPPSVAVLGGSRVANLRAEMFSGDYDRGFLNTSVTSGTIRDYVAIWQMMKQNGFKPGVVFIGVEEQSLNSASQNDKYLSILESYESFFEKGASPRVRLMGLTTDLKDLLSLQTTAASLKSVFGDSAGEGRLIERKDYTGAEAARTASLSLLYPKSYRNRPAQTVEAEGNDNGRAELKVFQKWNAADRRGYEQLRALIRDIQKSGARPVLIGMPYHPEAYRLIADDAAASRNLQTFVTELKNIAASENASFYDAISEHAADFTGRDFIDGVHLKVMPNYTLLEKAAASAGLSLINPNFKED